MSQIRAGDKTLKLVSIPGVTTQVALVIHQDAPAPGHLPKKLIDIVVKVDDLETLLKEARGA